MLQEALLNCGGSLATNDGAAQSLCHALMPSFDAGCDAALP
jgi:hypothetical protein